jgi:hypothetical protein
MGLQWRYGYLGWQFVVEYGKQLRMTDALVSSTYASQFNVTVVGSEGVAKASSSSRCD